MGRSTFLQMWQHLMYLNWQHLIYFLVAAELESFTAAADRLFVTQSTLTKAMNNLENVLGVPLFEKRGRNIRLTTYGEQFRKDLIEVTEKMNSGISTLHDMIDLKSGNISMGGSYTMCAEYLPIKIRRYRKYYPDIDFSIKYTATDSILRQVLDGTVELGFCGDYDANLKMYENIERFKIREQELILIAPKGSEWEKEGTIKDFSEFAKAPFIVNANSNTGTDYVFNRICEQAGFEPNIAFESNDDHTLTGMVASGLGVALIENSPYLLVGDVAQIHFENPPVKNLYMVFNKNQELSPLVKSFVEFIHDEEAKGLAEQ